MVPNLQNERNQLERLAAQRQLYSVAKRWFALHIGLSVPVVVGLSLLGAKYPHLKVYAASWGIFVSVLDLLFLTPKQKELKKQAAKIQEAFDCDVLCLEWSELKVGARLELETIKEAAGKLQRVDPDFDDLKNWYSIQVSELQPALARLVCQRTNIWWDSHLRRRYAAVITVSLAIVALVVFLVSLIGGLTVEELILAVLVPLQPLFLLGLRQSREQNDTAASLDRLRDYAVKLWDAGIRGTLDSTQLTAQSRTLQDAIYDHRRNSPLIFDWMYKRLKRKQEQQMNRTAESLVEEARTKGKLRDTL